MSDSTVLISVVVDSVIAFFTFGLLLVAIYQLRLIGRQIKHSHEEAKRDSEQHREILINNANNLSKWKSIEICELYNNDPVITQCSKHIRTNTKFFKNSDNIEDISHDAIVVLNYFDSLAIGRYQKVYQENILLDHFRFTLPVYIKIVLKPLIDRHMLNEHNYRYLIQMSEDWQKIADPQFKDDGPILVNNK